MNLAYFRLAVFSAFFWVTWATLAYLTSPTDSQGHYSPLVIIGFFVLLFGGLFCSLGLGICFYKSHRPNQKLPHLLIRDSLIQAAIISTGITGLLVLQLLRSASLLNLLLWVCIIGCLEWFIYQQGRVARQKRYRTNADDQDA